MASFDFNNLLAQAEAEGFDDTPLPADTYEAQVVSAEPALTKANKQMFKVRFKVLSGPYAGKSIFTNMTISPENSVALAIFFRQMSALGLKKEFFAGNPEPEAIAKELNGKYAKVTTKMGEYNGDPKTEVSGVKSLPNPPAPVAPSAAATPSAAAPAPSPAPPAAAPNPGF